MKIKQEIEIDDIKIIEYLLGKMDTDEAEDFLMPLVHKYVILDEENLKNIIDAATGYKEFYEEREKNV